MGTVESPKDKFADTMVHRAHAFDKGYGRMTYSGWLPSGINLSHNVDSRFAIMDVALVERNVLDIQLVGVAP